MNDAQMKLAVTLGLTIFVIMAAMLTARRKGRSSKWWMFGTFCFMPIYYLLLVLPSKKDKAPASNSILNCLACAKDVSVSAKACPHCGHPNPTISDQPPKWTFAIEVIGAIIPALAIVAVIYNAKHPVGELPDCDSTYATDNVPAIIAASPLGKTTGLAVLQMDNMREVLVSKDLIQCSASAHLNTGETKEIDYSFSPNPGHDTFWIKAEIQP